MQKKLTKLMKTISILIVLMMVSANFLPVSVYAANEISQTANTKEENVKFDVKINGTYDAQLLIGQTANLEISASVQKAGYLKDAKVTLEGINYSLQNIENENVKISKDNIIQLSEIDQEQELNVNIPITFNKEQTQSEKDFNNTSKIKLEAIYVNEEGKEKKIEKTINEKVRWDSTSEEEISQKLIRYIKYENKTLVTFEISEGIKDNSIPIKNKEISIVAPMINNQVPTKTIVSGNETNYKSEGATTKIAKAYNPTEDGKYSWNSQEKYVVTYIYNTQSNAETISTNATANVTDINKKQIEGKTLQNTYEVKGQIGSLVEVSGEATPDINKGYMYTSLKRTENKLNTTYIANYRINVGFADVIDSIKASEGNIYFTDENGNSVKDANESIYNSKVKVNKEQVTDLLGENGVVSIKNEKGEIIAQLNKNEVEKDINASKITIETTKPNKEGTIDITFLKAIKGDSINSKEELGRAKNLVTEIKSEGLNGETVISNSTMNYVSHLSEPTSKATFDTNTNRLSTVVENKNVSFNIVLNKNDISDALYTNPTVKIRFPEEVNNVTVTSARVLYEEEIKEGNIEINGTEIVLKLQGNQTQYNKTTTTAGTLIKIDTNIGLNMLAPSNKKNVEVEITNEFTGEKLVLNKEMEIIAPSGFVTTNTIKIDGQSVTALEDNVDPIKVKALQDEKTLEVSANLVNNLETSANGLTVLGRIPSEGNKTIGGEDLGSNINTTLASPVETTGFDDTTIYYSDNINEPVNGNGWNTQATSNSKSFKIVKQSPLNDKSAGTFKYTVKVPANLDYEKQIKENYGIYYNNNSAEGATTNLIESRTVGIMTGSAPAIKTEISAIDTNAGYSIDNNGTATEGEYVTYRVKVTNTGSYDAHNVKVTTTLPDWLSLVKYEETKSLENIKGYEIDETTKTTVQEIAELKAGESKTISVNTMVNQVISRISNEMQNGWTKSIEDAANSGKLGDLIDANLNKDHSNEINNAKNINVKVDVNADILEEPTNLQYTIKNSEGTVNAKLDLIKLENKQNLEQGDVALLKMTVRNANMVEKNNVTVHFNLPAGMDIEEIKTSEGILNNDNNKNINIGQLAGLSAKYVTVKVKNNGINNTKYNVFATVTGEGIAEEIKSNTIEMMSLSANEAIKATQTANITNNITDKDSIELYTDIENVSDIEQNIKISELIQDELAVNRYVITVNDQTVFEGNTNYINSTVLIPAHAKAKLTVYANPYPTELGKSIDVTSRPTITTINDNAIEVNELKLRINGTAEAETAETVEQGDVENSVTVEETNVYRINGNAWIDENRNGKKDIDEISISGVQLKLYNVKTNSIVKNANGNDIVVITEENGMYTFDNLEAGEYVVIAYYNNDEYELSTYKAESIPESENDDFVSTNYEDTTVGVTDVIEVSDKNQYNIDLGLMPKQKFDLTIAKNISKITVSSNEEGTKQYDVNNDKVRIELSSKELENSTILVEYNIQVTNNGDVAGYAKSIVDYLPKGMTFNSELNKDWYLSKDGNLYTVSLANNKIEPGQSENVKLILTRKVTNGNVGIVRGKTSINTTYNELGLKEISAQSNIKVNANSNLATADIIIAKDSTTKAIISIVIAIGVIALTGFAIYEVKKQLDKKYYVDSDI